MAMKKTTDGNFPLWQGAGKSFWTLLIFGSMAVVDHDVFWKSDRVFRFFPLGGLYRRRGVVRSGPGGAHHRGAWASPGHAPWWCGPQWLSSGSSLVFWKLHEISGRLALVLSNSRIFPV
jgi:hypothetical protein